MNEDVRTLLMRYFLLRQYNRVAKEESLYKLLAKCAKLITGNTLLTGESLYAFCGLTGEYANSVSIPFTSSVDFYSTSTKTTDLDRYRRVRDFGTSKA